LLGPSVSFQDMSQSRFTQEAKWASLREIAGEGRTRCLCKIEVYPLLLPLEDECNGMTKKPKFLYRLHEYESWYASLGRKMKEMKRQGTEDWGVKERQILVRELLKKRKVTERHIRWHEIYEPVFDKAYSYAKSKLEYTDKRAFKYARAKAENAVVITFNDEVKTERAVRDAMHKLGYCETEKPS
jgi:hypothetical protein